MLLIKDFVDDFFPPNLKIYYIVFPYIAKN